MGKNKIKETLMGSSVIISIEKCLPSQELES